MSRWGSLQDLYRIVKCRRASRKDAFDEAIGILDGGASPGSRYDYFVPLYRLTLMVCAKDARRIAEAGELLERDWTIQREDDQWLEAYRRYLCCGVLGDFDKSDAAATELRRMSARGFIKSTIGVPK